MQILREKLCKKSEYILNFLKGEFMNVLDLLREKDFLKLPKPLVSTVGADETVMLMELLTGYDHWEELGRAEDGWIFPTCGELEKRVNFAQPKQNRILDKLEKMGVLLIKRRKDFGRLRPKRRAIKINEEAVKNIFMWNKE